MQILRSLAHNRHLIGEMVKRDVLGRYLGSAIGVFWSVINPLVTLLVYTVVFSSVLKVRLGESDSGVLTFVEYLFAGLLPWITFQESVSRSASCVLENVSLVQKMRFPTEILPINLALSGFVHQLIGTALYFVLLAAAGDLHFRWLFLLPAVFLIQLIGTVGFGWIVATLNVYFRDVAQLLGALLTVWFWATPIVYNKDMAPDFFRKLLLINPATHLVEIYRAVILAGSPAPWVSWAVLTGYSAAVFLLGAHIMWRCKKEFADLI